MRFITCASYYGVGSSAVTDLLSEYEGIYNFTNFEFRFLQDPDGISDLEYNLVENHNRHNSGHALKRYKRLVDFYCGTRFARKYEGFFHGNWKKYSYEYIDALTDFKYHGNWMYDFYDRGNFFYYRKMLPNKLLKMTVWKNKPDRQLNMLPNEWTYCSAPTEEKFLALTKKYIEDLFSSVAQGCNTLMVDQIVPPTNLKRFLRYFEDIKVFVVDRDPRDLWVLSKYVWKDGVLPHEDVETFCKWFRYTRQHRKIESLEGDEIFFLRFEDLIFHYNETVDQIQAWLGLSSDCHKRFQEVFDPEKSIANTQTWLRLKNIPLDEINRIESELGEYLYNDFPDSVMKDGMPGLV